MLLASTQKRCASSRSTASSVAAAYGLLGVGFAMILGVTGRFHFAYGFTYTLAAYLAFTFTFRVDLPFWPAAILGVAGRPRASVRGIERCRLPPARGATPVPPRCWRCSSPRSASASPARTSSGCSGARRRRRTTGPTKEAYTHRGTPRFTNFDVWQAASGVVHRARARASMLRFTRPRPARSRPPGSTPTWPASSASTPTSTYVIVLLHRHALRRRGGRSGTA